MIQFGACTWSFTSARRATGSNTALSAILGVPSSKMKVKVILGQKIGYKYRERGPRGEDVDSHRPRLKIASVDTGSGLFRYEEKSAAWCVYGGRNSVGW